MAGSYTTPIQITTGTATSPSSLSTFYTASGSAQTMYALVISVPGGARGILAVMYTFGTAHSAYASPLGALDGVANAVAVDAASTFYFEMAGAMSLSTSAIVVPVYYANVAYKYTVVWY